MPLFVWIFLVSILSHKLARAQQPTSQEEQQIKAYGFAFTTIPPRFRSLGQTISTLLHQEYLEPELLLLSIPREYSRFDCIEDELCLPTPAAGLLKLLGTEFPVEVAYDRIQTVSVDHDYGPLTKTMGLLQNFDRYPEIMYWIICDDDVGYTSDTYLRYHHALKATSYKYVLTHFSEDYRIAIKFHRTEEERPKRVQHVQGVDTYLIPTEILLSNALLKFTKLRGIVDFFHSVCPLSYYQDDYIISFLFHIAKVPIKSTWNNQKVAEHIDDVSLSNHQMHRDHEVFDREEQTKSCITLNAFTIYKNYIQSNVNLKIVEDVREKQVQDL